MRPVDYRPSPEDLTCAKSGMATKLKKQEREARGNSEKIGDERKDETEADR